MRPHECIGFGTVAAFLFRFSLGAAIARQIKIALQRRRLQQDVGVHAADGKARINACFLEKFTDHAEGDDEYRAWDRLFWNDDRFWRIAAAGRMLTASLYVVGVCVNRILGLNEGLSLEAASAVPAPFMRGFSPPSTARQPRMPMESASCNS